MKMMDDENGAPPFKKASAPPFGKKPEASGSEGARRMRALRMALQSGDDERAYKAFMNAVACCQAEGEDDDEEA